MSVRKQQEAGVRLGTRLISDPMAAPFFIVTEIFHSRIQYYDEKASHFYLLKS